MKFNIKHIVGCIMVLLSTVSNAQFYVGVQSGIANIQSDVKGVSASTTIGGAVKAGYIYSITKNLGIGTGLEFSQYKQEVFLQQGTSTLTNFEVDATGSAFIYNVTTSNYRENQTLHAIQIPLFVEYKKNINKGVDFNFRAGAKYFLPINYKIDATASSVRGTAFYPDVNLTIDNLPEYGLGNQANYSASGEYSTKGVAMSSFELGFTFKVSEKNALYAAMFLENSYGSILKQERNESFVGFNPASVSNREANGLYSTVKSAEINVVSFGLTLGYNFL